MQYIISVCIFLQSETTTPRHYISYGGDTLSLSDESCNLDSDSNSDYSYQAISPITEEEYDTSDSTDESEGVLPVSDSLHRTTFSLGLQPASTSTVEQCGHSQTMYHFCSDNIDKTVKQCYMRSDAYKTGSIHYFHSYAVADRIDFSSLPETTPPLPSVDVLQLATSLLPSPEDDVALRKNVATLVSCILFGSIDFFKLTFDDVVEWHIKHEFYEQMSRKSDVVSIGV